MEHARRPDRRTHIRARRTRRVLPDPASGGGHRVTAAGQRVSGPREAIHVPPRSRVPVGIVAFLTGLYAILYFVWEQSGWGSSAW